MGLPFALTLFRAELDLWSPGEHNGTFRGNNHAFVTATAALRHFWSDKAFEDDIARRGDLIAARLDAMARDHGFETRGRGMMRGINVGSGELADAVTTARSEEHTSELQSLMRISYAVFCLKKKTHNPKNII